MLMNEHTHKQICRDIDIWAFGGPGPVLPLHVRICYVMGHTHMYVLYIFTSLINKLVVVCRMCDSKMKFAFDFISFGPHIERPLALPLKHKSPSVNWPSLRIAGNNKVCYLNCSDMTTSINIKISPQTPKTVASHTHTPPCWQR